MKHLAESILKQVLLVALICFFSTDIMAQSASGWTLSSSQNQTEISYKTTTCGSNTYLLFKVENKAGQAATVDFSCTISNPTDSVNVPHISTTLAANSSKEGTCNSGSTDNLFVRLPLNYQVGQVATTIH